MRSVCVEVLLRSDGGAVAFGDGRFGQTRVPEPPAGVFYLSAACGEAHSVLLRSDGRAVAFGRNAFGESRVPELPPGLQYAWWTYFAPPKHAI